MEPTSAATAGVAVIVAKSFADSAAGLLTRMLGKPCDLIGEAASDQIRYWQWCNRVAIFHKASERLRQLNSEARPVPPAFLIPLLEASGMVDDEGLQGLFAELIASANRPGSCSTPFFVDTLKRLLPEDAKVLNTIRDIATKEEENFCRIEELGDSAIASIDRLVAMGLVARDVKPEDTFGEEGELLSGADDIRGPLTIDPEAPVVVITGYGRQFMDAIGRPVTVANPEWFHEDGMARFE